MIRSLYGEILSVGPNTVLLDVNGLGFEPLCSRAALALCTPGARVRLTVQLQFSETGAALYAFVDESEREIFLKITTIKGIGGKTGMGILSVLSSAEVVRAVALADVGAFMRAPGVGRKTAERICFELKTSLPKDFAATVETSGKLPASRVSDTVEDALRSLGFAQSDATMALRVVQAALGDEFATLNEELLLKAALKELQRK